MNTKPAISVVMPSFNAERFIAEAIESILAQTFTDFEFIIINDGSIDNTEEIIKSYTDPRIVYINNGSNLGLSKSFNAGIEAAQGKYFARMDADDISLPNRLATQFAFLEANPQVGIVGSSLWFIDVNGKRGKIHRRLEDHIDIKFASLFSTPIIHPSVMGRLEVFRQNRYDEGLFNSEDYELWSRLLFKTNTRFANISEPLLLYRVFPDSFTQTLNLDKRTVSAHNTIQNIGHYVTLSQKEKETMVRLRQEHRLSAERLLSIFYIYLRAARAFSVKEHLGLRKSLRIYLRLAPLAVFLAKYKVKQHVR